MPSDFPCTWRASDHEACALSLFTSCGLPLNGCLLSSIGSLVIDMAVINHSRGVIDYGDNTRISGQ